MAEINRKIPEDIKREVRKRCGFGCVICGIPIFEYDHIEEWSKVQKHEANNITLLCDMHHKEKTNRLLSKDQVLKANSNPFNIINNLSNPHKLNYDSKEFSIYFGDMRFRIENLNTKKDFLIPLLVDNMKLISFDIEEEQLFLNVALKNDLNEMLLRIENNELIYSAENWDVEFIANRLKIRRGFREIIFDVEFLIPNCIKIHKAEFFYNNRKILVDKNGIKMNGFSFKGREVVNFRIGLAIGEFNERTSCTIRLG